MKIPFDDKGVSSDVLTLNLAAEIAKSRKMFFINAAAAATHESGTWSGKSNTRRRRRYCFRIFPRPAVPNRVFGGVANLFCTKLGSHGSSVLLVEPLFLCTSVSTQHTRIYTL
jgi:hypothetical protein